MSNYEIFVKYQQVFEINRKGFLRYLALREYSIRTRSKTKSTSFEYLNAVDKIYEFENIDSNIVAEESSALDNVAQEVIESTVAEEAVESQVTTSTNNNLIDDTTEVKVEKTTVKKQRKNNKKYKRNKK